MIMQLIRLLKDWTLPVAIGTGCVVYIIFALVPQLDGFATAAAPVFDAMLPMFMFLVLFVTFCKVDFRKLRPVAWHWWVGVFQLLCVGAVMAAVLAFGLSGNLLILAVRHQSVCIGCSGRNAEARRQPRRDDHLHLPLQLHNGTDDTCLLPAPRQRTRDALPRRLRPYII